MKISDAAIDRNTTVIVSLGLIVAVGLYCYFALPRESDPEVVIPYVNIMVTYQGVSPEDMETLVTIPIETKLTGIEGVKEIRSASAEGLAMVTIEFEPGQEMEVALQRVRDKVDLAKTDLPEDADDAIVSEINFSEMPIVLVNLTGKATLSELTQMAEDLEDRVEAIPGVLEVHIAGAVEREIQIEVDPVRLSQYGVSLGDLVNLARTENINTPAGAMDVGEAKYLMRVPGEIHGAAELRDLVVKQGETGVVYLRDLAEVRDGFKPVESYSRLNSEPSVTLTVSKRSGENIIAVAGEIRAVVEETQKTLPPDVSLLVTVDESERIKNRIEDLENNILSGLILVVLILCVSLGLSNAFFVSLAIPLSLLITFIVMYFLDMSLNMVTLFSLMVALGMLVDNGIVVVENIYRHGQMGKSKIQAAKDGTREVSMAVLASTITTVAAFLPMVFWPGMMGMFMRLLPLTVIIALFASLFVAMIVNPALAAIFIRVSKSAQHDGDELAGHHPILNTYGALLEWALRWRMASMTLMVTGMISVTAIYFTGMKYEFLPSPEAEQARINVTGPEGASLDATDAIIRQIEGIVAPERKNVEYVIANVGSRGVSARGGMMRGGSGGQTSHVGSLTLDFPPPGSRPDADLPSEVIARLRHAFEGLSGAEVRIEETVMGPPAGAAVHIELTGEDFGELGLLAREIRARIADVPGLVDLEDDLEGGKPEVRVVVDREQARLAKLNTMFIGQTVQAAVNGRKAGEFRVGDDEYDVTVRFPEAFREDLFNLESMDLVNLEGRTIPFSSVADLEQGVGLGQITRVDRKRMVTITADAEGRSGPEVLADAREKLAGISMPPGYTISYGGENEDIQLTIQFLVAAFFVSLFLIALVLITEFNSVVQTFIIMTSVILSLAGVFFGLLLFDMTFGVMMTGIGCVSLAGIVVNNAIVLVDYINQLRDRGMSMHDAVVIAGKTRFRPVLLGAVSNVVGLVPMALGVSFDFRKFEWQIGTEMDAFWGSMAVAIIFGLSFATVLTLVIVPVLYSLSDSVSRFLRRAPVESALPLTVS